MFPLFPRTKESALRISEKASGAWWQSTVSWKRPTSRRSWRAVETWAWSQIAATPPTFLAARGCFQRAARAWPGGGKNSTSSCRVIRVRQRNTLPSRQTELWSSALKSRCKLLSALFQQQTQEQQSIAVTSKAELIPAPQEYY